MTKRKFKQVLSMKYWFYFSIIIVKKSIDLLHIRKYQCVTKTLTAKSIEEEEEEDEEETNRA